jgi:hypothetical protein
MVHWSSTFDLLPSLILFIIVSDLMWTATVSLSSFSMNSILYFRMHEWKCVILCFMHA